MIELADDFSLGRGIVTVAHLYEGDAHAKASTKAAEMNQFLTQRRIDAFCEVDMVPEYFSGILTVSQANRMLGCNQHCHTWLAFGNGLSTQCCSTNAST